MRIDTDLLRNASEFIRAIEQHQYEVTPAGIEFPRKRLVIAGQFLTRVNGRDAQIDPNIVPAEGIARILKSGLNTTLYIAPFLNDITLLSTLTAANFDTQLDEFTDYDESARRQWVIPTDPVAGVYTNEASPATFTAATAVGTGAGVDVIGAGIISASAKNATTGFLVCASKFTGARNLKTGDVLTVEYSIAGTSTS